MTKKEFEKLQKETQVPCNWIGQGYGYKDEREWDKIPEADVIYIPEYAYAFNGSGSRICDPDDAFTKESFRDAVRTELRQYNIDIEGADSIIEDMAEDLFCSVDWQYPSSLVEEGWLDDWLDNIGGAA